MNNKHAQIYIWMKQSESVTEPKVYLDTVAKVYCTEKEIETGCKTLLLHQFSENETCCVTITALYMIACIGRQFPNADVQMLGDDACIVYHKQEIGKRSVLKILYYLLVACLAFLGAGFSIMTYNTDVGITELLLDLHTFFLGEEVERSFGMFTYSLGLFLGMMLFFNHGILGRRKKEPTPLQVEMRTYETEVNTASITGHRREGVAKDVD